MARRGTVASTRAGGWGGIRTHGRLHVAGFQDRCLKPLGHPSAIVSAYRRARAELCKARGEPSWPDRAWRSASAVVRSGCGRAERVGDDSMSAVFARHGSPVRGSPARLAQAAARLPTYAQLSHAGDRRLVQRTSCASRRWRASRACAKRPIQDNVPGLTVNQRVIDLERNEPIARTSNGVVGALAPYLRSARDAVADRAAAADNYSDHYGALRALEARYGVDPAVLMAIWGTRPATARSRAAPTCSRRSPALAIMAAAATSSKASSSPRSS